MKLRIFLDSKNIIKKDENYPFGKRKYVIPSGGNKKKALSQTEVTQIYKYQPTPNSSEDKPKISGYSAICVMELILRILL